MFDSEKRLPQSFCRRDAEVLAPDLVGRWLKKGPVVLEITEVEAYLWRGDSACHARNGKTSRNSAMFGPPGCAYVYLCYGIHNLLNVVCNSEGEGAAGLIRSCRPIDGTELVIERRGGRSGPDSLAGPGKVGAALVVLPRWSGHELYAAGGLELLGGRPVESVLCGPRVGIGYADQQDQEADLRFAEPGTRWVSWRGKMKPDPVEVVR